jgi:hypothetical protein
MTEFLSKARILKCLFSKLPLFYILLKYSVVPVIDVNECFHDFMFVNRAPPPPAPVNLVLQHWCKALQSLYCTIRRLFVAYSRTVLFVAYSRTIRTIRRLFVLFVDYSHYSRTIRRLFADYSYYSSTIRGLFALFVDYSRTIRTIRRLFALFVDCSHYSLHYSSFINCPCEICNFQSF